MATLHLHSGERLLKSLEMRRPVIRIGKAPDNDIVLEQSGISRYHCEIHNLADGSHLIRDLGSRNGTFLNGRQLDGESPIGENAMVVMGEYRLSFEGLAAAKAGAQPARAAARPDAPSKATPQLMELRKSVHQELLNHIDLKKLDFTKLSNAEIRQRTESAIIDILKKRERQIPPEVQRNKFIQELVDQALGLGPLEDLLRDDTINEIMVNNYDRIYIERAGKIQLTSAQFMDNDHVLEVIRRIIAPIGRRIDESSPLVDARLSDGSRVNAIIAPLALSGPTVTIRKFSRRPFTIDDLVRFGALTRPMAEFLRLCVVHRKNVCISGGTGSGKTTLLNVLAGFIPEGERIVTIEDSAELRLSQEHVITLESKPANLEGEGAIPIRKLVINSLRMRPDRIIIGECRGGEALDMLQAMNTGHDGSLTTLHANTCRDALSRLETMVLMAGLELPSKAIRDQIASAVDVIVQTNRFLDGTRKITNISMIAGQEGDVISLQDVFEFKQSGLSREGKVLGDYVPSGTVPAFMHELKKRGIEVDFGIFR